MAEDAPILGVAERADFGPAYDGESYVTITFRIRKDIGAIPGIWELRPLRPGSFDWARTKDKAAEAKREAEAVQ